ncbi:MAG: ATP-binding protein [Butyrivibrio sp.]|nr:ATP-binding protein [Butyrivibrio sp.]
MDDIDLRFEIQELIERRAEGEYWDFKQQWHSCNADLLHDIICMANSPANRDCYIIIGIEDKTYHILGVSDENRKNQQNVIDLLRQKPSWAGGYIPEAYVKTISIADKEVDVIVANRVITRRFIC